MVNFTNIHFPGLLSQFIDIPTKFWCVEKNNIKCGMCSVTQLCPTLCDPWTPLSMEFSRQGYWSGLPFPAPGDLPEGSNPSFLYLLYWQADSLPLVPPVEEKIISTYALIQPEATSFVLYTQLFSAVLQHWLKWKL